MHPKGPLLGDKSISELSRGYSNDWGRLIGYNSSTNKAGSSSKNEALNNANDDYDKITNKESRLAVWRDHITPHRIRHRVDGLQIGSNTCNKNKIF